jgi:hypothetical protein
MGDRTDLIVGRIEKIVRLKKLQNLCNGFQNGLAFLGQIGKVSLFEFPETEWSLI